MIIFILTMSCLKNKEKQLAISYFDLCDLNKEIFSNLKKMITHLNDVGCSDLKSFIIVINTFNKAIDFYKKILFLRKEINFLTNDSKENIPKLSESDEEIVKNFVARQRHLE